MVQDSTGMPVENIKDLLVKKESPWKEFFEAKFNPNIADSLVEPYVCNWKPPTEEKIIYVIHKLKVNKISVQDVIRAELSKYCPSSFITCFQQILCGMDERNTNR